MLSKIVVISWSNRPRGSYRLNRSQAHATALPAVPFEYVNALDGLIAEQMVCRKISDGHAVDFKQIETVEEARDIIEHEHFLYVVEVETDFERFLVRYASIPIRCPVCRSSEIGLAPPERLKHIIGCRWKNACVEIHRVVAQQLS